MSAQLGVLEEIPERMTFVPVDTRSLNERGRLIRHICESIRIYAPAQRIDAYHRIKARLCKTPLSVLREIVEEDVVNVTAAQFIRNGVR